MKKLRSVFASAYLWVLTLPLFLAFVGAASNQIVLAANHDRFPVMLNPARIVEIAQHTDPGSAERALLVEYGMIDDIHCVMTKDTHLNFLADWIDLRDATYSPGDLLIELGESLGPLSLPVWFALVLNAFYRKESA